MWHGRRQAAVKQGSRVTQPSLPSATGTSLWADIVGLMVKNRHEALTILTLSQHEHKGDALSRPRLAWIHVPCRQNWTRCLESKPLSPHPIAHDTPCIAQLPKGHVMVRAKPNQPNRICLLHARLDAHVSPSASVNSKPVTCNA